MHENVQYFGKRLREYVMMNIGIMHYAVLCLKDDIFLYVTITIIQQWTLDNPSSSLSSQNCLKGHLRSKQFYVPYVNPQLSLDKTQSIADHQLTLGHHQHQQQSVDCLVTVVNNLFNIYKVSSRKQQNTVTIMCIVR